MSAPRNLAWLLLLWPLACPAEEYLHPKLKSRERTVHTVLIVPPRMSYTRNGVKGSENLPREGENLGAEVSYAVSREFKNKGVTIPESPFTAIALKGKTELITALEDLQGQYDRSAELILKRPNDVAKARYTLGGDVARLEAGTPVDAYVFIRGAANEPTKGKAFLAGVPLGGALGGLASMVNREANVDCYISLVDARTGDVLFFAKVASDRFNLGRRLRKAFKKVPAAR